MPNLHELLELLTLAGLLGLALSEGVKQVRASRTRQWRRAHAAMRGKHNLYRHR